MNGRNCRKKASRMEMLLARMLPVLAVVILFGGLILQIGLRAQLSQQSKDIAAVQKEIDSLEANAENLTLCINSNHNLVRIEELARELGMNKHTKDQLRVVNLSMPGGYTAAQTVAAGGGEEING